MASRLGQQLDDVCSGLVRPAYRRSRPVLQAIEALRLITLGPLVSGHPADPVALAQLAHREKLPLKITDELHALSHLRRLAPGHPAPPLVPHAVGNC
jgi:hypothetical protein